MDTGFAPRPYSALLTEPASAHAVLSKLLLIQSSFNGPGTVNNRQRMHDMCRTLVVVGLERAPAAIVREYLEGSAPEQRRKRQRRWEKLRQLEEVSNGQKEVDSKRKRVRY